MKTDFKADFALDGGEWQGRTKSGGILYKSLDNKMPCHNIREIPQKWIQQKILIRVLKGYKI